jgi:hypothetical protein
LEPVAQNLKGNTYFLKRSSRVAGATSYHAGVRTTTAPNIQPKHHHEASLHVNPHCNQQQLTHLRIRLSSSALILRERKTYNSLAIGKLSKNAETIAPINLPHCRRSIIEHLHIAKQATPNIAAQHATSATTGELWQAGDFG